MAPDQGQRAGENISLWEARAEAHGLNPLHENRETDACVVGAGTAGLSVAYTQGRAGRGVVVLDDGLIGSGMTGRTTAHLVNALDNRYTSWRNCMAKMGRAWPRKVIPRQSIALSRSRARSGIEWSGHIGS